MRDGCKWIALRCAIVAMAIGGYAHAEEEKRVEEAFSVPAAFDAPPRDELSNITHAKIRMELLRMVHEDQVARKGGG